MYAETATAHDERVTMHLLPGGHLIANTGQGAVYSCLQRVKEPRHQTFHIGSVCSPGSEQRFPMIGTTLPMAPWQLRHQATSASEVSLQYPSLTTIYN